MLRVALPGLRQLHVAATKQAPILWHYCKNPVPYVQGLELQEALVSRRVDAKIALLAHEEGERKLPDEELRKHTTIASQDVLLLLQHTPVYTTGRRETDPEILKIEKERLTAIGADYIATQRGGQTTYHGPGQLVGYPILDTGAMGLSTRCYVQGISDFLERLLVDKLKVPLLLPPPHVGAYPSATTKIGSIGIQIRRRITSHGFSLNVTDDVKHWFDQIIACGDATIKATSIESELQKLGKLPRTRPEVEDVVPLAVQQIGEIFKRELMPLAGAGDAQLEKLIREYTSVRVARCEQPQATNSRPADPSHLEAIGSH